MTTTIDLNRIVAFARVLETGSFTRAAQLLALPKSSVSRSVSQLEASLGVRLLHRTTRSLRPTDAGAAYFDRVSRALGGLDEATSQVTEQEGAVRGTVRMTVSVHLAASLLPQMVLDLRRAHPEIRLELIVTNGKPSLIEEGIDLAVRAGKLDDSSLVARRLIAEHGGLFASRHYLKKRGTPRRLADLERHDLLGFLPRDAGGVWRLFGPRGEETVPLHTRLLADDLIFTQLTAAAGGGICLLPAPTIARHMGLTRVLPRYQTALQQLHLVYPSARYLAQRVAVVRDFLVERFSEMAA